jgi:ribonuclease P protein component
LYIRPRDPDGMGVRLGTTVTKKVGKAVLRTRLKRLIKEVFRLNKEKLRGHDVDVVVVAKKNIHGKSMKYELAERELMRTIHNALLERCK